MSIPQTLADGSVNPEWLAAQNAPEVVPEVSAPTEVISDVAPATPETETPTQDEAVG